MILFDDNFQVVNHGLDAKHAYIDLVKQKINGCCLKDSKCHYLVCCVCYVCYVHIFLDHVSISRFTDDSDHDEKEPMIFNATDEIDDDEYDTKDPDQDFEHLKAEKITLETN